MSSTQIALHRAIDELSDIQLEALYRVVACFARPDFDAFTPEESLEINRSFDELRRGEGTRFESGEVLADFFGVKL
ncbi:hypothetical protein FACS1894217_03210 [Clostridia bacterium]|nr:hypothetical protein FACS1894217_03210 [Clostridia bacterium]